MKSMYVDGYVFAVPKKNIAMYKKMAREGAKVWKKFGAIDFKECRGDDLNSSMGMTPFSKLLNLKKDETAWFSFVTYKNRKHRDAVNKKVMEYFAKKYDKDMPMPFAPKRMSTGGFKVEVSS